MSVMDKSMSSYRSKSYFPTPSQKSSRGVIPSPMSTSRPSSRILNESASIGGRRSMYPFEEFQDDMNSSRYDDNLLSNESMYIGGDDMEDHRLQTTHKDTNNYQPIQVFSLEKNPLSIHVVANQLSQDIVILRFRKHIAVYYLKIKVPEISVDAPASRAQEAEDIFELVVIQELLLDGNKYVEAVALSSNVSLSFSEKNLVYAFSLTGKNAIYFVENKGDEILPRIDLARNNRINLVVENESAVTHLKYDADQSRLIACLVEEPACNVWDTKTGQKVAEFQLQDRGVAICWHKSEPAKLMVAERGGKIIFLNVMKQLAVQSISVCPGPIFCADWAAGNSHLIGCASHCSAYVVDVSQPYSNQIKVFETHPHFTLKLKFSNTDPKVFSTMGKSDNKIKVFQLNFRSIVWSQKRQDLQDIEWLRGRPYLLSISGNKLAIHESSILS